MIPEIQYDFNFDIILVMIFVSYIIYGYFSGGHKQIRLSINLILPFMIIYYLGRYITTYLYIPLSSTFIFELINTYLGIVKNTLGMAIAYIITYIFLFVGVFLLSIFARRHILNENMRAKLGVKNNYLGALFALINGYVLIYFIILPVFSLNLVDTNSSVTNFVLENPPPFSRIARTAEKAVPIKGLADKADAFQQLLSVDGIEGYYNDAIYDYQLEYIGDTDSFEYDFMDIVYPELSEASLTLLETAYASYFSGEVLTSSNYLGVSRVLVEEMPSGSYLYEELLDTESTFQSDFDENSTIASDYLADLEQYEIDIENYEYQVIYDLYQSDLEDYLADAEAYLEAKIQAILNDQSVTYVMTETRPSLDVAEPPNYEEVSPLIEPAAIEHTPAIIAAENFVSEYEDKIDISDELKELGENFLNHKGLLMWYVDELDREMASSASGGDISEIIVSYKEYYETIVDNVDDKDLESKLYLAQMSIVSYDVFSEWIVCTTDHIDTVELDDIQLSVNRCDSINPSAVDDYDFANDALDIVKTLFEGESVSWIILQFKYDYDAGIFTEYFADYPEVTEVLDSTKSLVDDYDTYYKDIANSIEGNISMVIKIGISVMKYNFDMYDTLEKTPLLSALFNDASRLCANRSTSELNRNVEICTKSDGDGGFFGEVLNLQYLASEVLFKAYLMVDEDNQAIIYDSETMQTFLDNTNQSVEKHVFSSELIEIWGDQFAFNVIDETSGYTLLEQMYDDGQISIEAMRILADDEYDLFSSEFSQRVRSLIR